MTRYDPAFFTYGAEHELGDWCQDDIPDGMKMDRRDVTCMNTNGIAADPLGKSYRFGGEINTEPTDTIEGQLWQLDRIANMGMGAMSKPTVNHRSNLHIHIRVPGLRDDLSMLKRVADFAHGVVPRVLPLIEPLPRPQRTDFYPDYGVPRNEVAEAEFIGALRRWRRRRVSHQTVLTPKRHALRMAAKTVDDFFAYHAPMKNGIPQHHLQPREAVNLRQLMETDTIEFRHFPGTLDPKRLLQAFTWCQDFLECALQDDIQTIHTSAAYTGQIIPWPEYVHWREVRYRATCHDGTLKRDEIERNIARIQNGEFDDHPV